MTFDRAVYEQTVARVQAGVQELSEGISSLRGNVAGLSGVSPLIIPPSLMAVVIEAVQTFLKWVVDLLAFIGQLLQGILAPLTFYGWGENWREIVRKDVTDSQSLMNGLPIAKSGDPLWKGRGAESYIGKVPAQVSAAQALGDVCDAAGKICLELAAAGCMLYLSVTVLLVTLTNGVATIGGLILSVIGIEGVPAGAVGYTTAGIALLGAVTAAMDYITLLTNRASDLRAAAENNASFPGPPVGQWPIAITEGSKGIMDDGTVTDGDADWSVPRR